MEKTKTAHLEQLETERRRLVNNLALLDALAPGAGLGENYLEEPGVMQNWSLKDLLAHLAEWEMMCVNWVAASRCGEEPQVPAPGVTWKNLDPLNAQIYEKYRSCPVDQVMEFFHSAHRQFMEMANGLSEEELMTPGYFPWCRPPLARWLAAYANHDAWGKRHLRAWMKAKKVV